MAAISLEQVKENLRIDNDYSDLIIQGYIDSAIAALSSTIGYTSDTLVLLEFDKLMTTYVNEYVRGLFFEKDNERMLNVMQTQLEAMIIKGIDRIE